MEGYPAMHPPAHSHAGVTVRVEKPSCKFLTSFFFHALLNSTALEMGWYRS